MEFETKFKRKEVAIKDLDYGECFIDKSGEIFMLVKTDIKDYTFLGLVRLTNSGLMGVVHTLSYWGFATNTIVEKVDLKLVEI